MAAVSVTSKGQVTIPKRIRQALGITPGSKVDFDLEGGGASLRLVKRRVESRVEDGPAILHYTGPRIPVSRMHGGIAMRKDKDKDKDKDRDKDRAAKRARR